MERKQGVMERRMDREVPDFEEFYSKSFPTVARAVRGLCDSRDEAWDITQEAFARTWGHWDEVGRRTHPIHFTLRVASNLAISKLRRLLTWRRISRELGEGNEPKHDPDLRLDLRAGMRSLPHRQRSAILLCDVIGLESAEAADVLGVSPSTLRVHLSRGRARLRRTLTLADEDDDPETDSSEPGTDPVELSIKKEAFQA
jgi:RNA polymerase sigma-70 factor (ECF subfamily)